MKILPLQQYVLLHVPKFDNETKSGIVIPQRFKKKIPIGTVISKGDYAGDDYNEGDVVIFSKSGTKALPDGDLVLCPSHRILLKEKWLKDNLKRNG